MIYVEFLFHSGNQNAQGGPLFSRMEFKFTKREGNFSKECAITNYKCILFFYIFSDNLNSIRRAFYKHAIKAVFSIPCPHSKGQVANINR